MKKKKLILFLPIQFFENFSIHFKQKQLDYLIFTHLINLISVNPLALVWVLPISLNIISKSNVSLHNYIMNI